MKSRNIVPAVAAILVLVAVLAWWAEPPASRFVPPSRAAPAAPAATGTGEVIPAANLNSGTSTPEPGGPIAPVTAAAGTNTPTPAPRLGLRTAQAAGVANSPQHEAGLVEVNKVRHMITDYHTLMGENPIGTNAEIMKALMGGNPHQAMLGPADGQGLNTAGELVDQWGTPYFFHQLSRDHMEIYSAGPDKIMGTADDIVVKW